MQLVAIYLMGNKNYWIIRLNNDRMIFENTFERISRKALHIRMAGLFALRGTCRRLQVGAVAVKEGRVISSGYNGALKGETKCSPEVCNELSPCSHAVHAEANLIAFSAKYGISLNGASIYVTHQPCAKCAELIIASGITHVYFRDGYRLKDGLDKLRWNGIIVEKIDEDGNTQQI